MLNFPSAYRLSLPFGAFRCVRNGPGGSAVLATVLYQTVLPRFGRFRFFINDRPVIEGDWEGGTSNRALIKVSIPFRRSLSGGRPVM